jgi:type I restriction enzyme S subunit
MDAQTAALFPDSFEESELGLMPKGWKLQTLAEAYEINPLRKLSKGQKATYLDMANVPTQGYSVGELIEREFGSGTKFKNHDTLLARITPCLENGKTAYVDFLTEEVVAWGSTEFIVLRPKAPLPPFHAYLLCRSKNFREHAIQSMSGTSGRQRVQNDMLGMFPVVIPNEEVAAKYSEVTGAIQAQSSANEAQAKTLTQLRDTLLPRLISGQLRLPDAHALAPWLSLLCDQRRCSANLCSKCTFLCTSAAMCIKNGVFYACVAADGD